MPGSSRLIATAGVAVLVGIAGQSHPLAGTAAPPVGATAGCEPGRAFATDFRSCGLPAG